MARETYEENMQFLSSTLARLERGEVGIDELETLSTEFAAAESKCRERLARIEAIAQESLRPESPL